jgi:hypothetical protein
MTAFFQGFVFWFAIDKLFLRVIGLSDELIAVVTVRPAAAGRSGRRLAPSWSRGRGFSSRSCAGR